MASSPIVVAEEVHEAVRAGRPVVALESTIFTHGLPRPRNLAVARDAETQLRGQGVTPATIGLVEGVPTVGLSDEQIEALSNDDHAVKVSVRDIAVAAVLGLNGGTTVAATALLATRAGITVFSTGGLGGVHKGASQTFDESADLPVLAGLPSIVVSAGAKSILDIGLTLERLETLNLAVVGYRTNRYPGFDIADSGHPLSYRVESPDEVARIAVMRDALGIRSSLLVANPVAEDKQLPPELHAKVIADAEQAARDAGIHGNATTPFLLDYIRRATDGASLDVNVEIYRGNVALGGEIASALAAIRDPAA